MEKRYLFIFPLLIYVIVAAGCAPKHHKPSISPEEKILNIKSFDYIWDTVKDKHWDASMNGVDWNGIKDELRPKVEAASSKDEARAVMQDLVSRLNQSHFAVFSEDAYRGMKQDGHAEEEEGKGLPDGWAGLIVRVVDGDPLIVMVDKGSPADLAGVKSGWVVLKVDGRKLKPLLNDIAEEITDEKEKRVVVSSVANNVLEGYKDEEKSILFLDGSRKKHELILNLSEKKGEKSVFGNLPPMYVWIEAMKLDGNIGYIAFNNFLSPGRLMTVYNEAMTDFMNAKGIILDLRGNGGGIAAMAMGMAGWLIEDKETYLGKMYMRGSELKLVIYPRANAFKGPVAILVDELSGSASEFLAGGLKDLGRARIFGINTAGAALPSMIERLPNGDGFQYAIANYISAGGEVLEGKGVIPDEEVCYTRDTLLDGKDAILERAVDWIKSN